MAAILDDQSKPVLNRYIIKRPAHLQDRIILLLKMRAQRGSLIQMNGKTRQDDCDISNSGYIMEIYYNVYPPIG